MPASKDQRRSKYLRRARRMSGRVGDRPKQGPSDRSAALSAAAAEKHKRLLELSSKYEPRIADLLAEYAEKRREVNADYEERKALIRQATILEA